ncbi:ATP-binding protein [Streptomyces fulvoviolaceus]|uniref:ATP-binding protein n=1 Tax=Streptomyces fulvoviolaceus TaxID=285535 RepID=UPI0021C152F5|nr:tetratricopeptide repeat protein [Streptomyces fulvoviolaceus]MCT9081534.1 tetratricopeptide repeat protein [Streptomyces fulvoviolaceus]
MVNQGDVAPGGEEDAAAFVASLRRLKKTSGLTYRQLEERAAARGDVLSRSTLAGALTRWSLPRADLVSAFVRACGCSGQEHRDWLEAHRRISAERTTHRQPSPSSSSPASLLPAAGFPVVPAQLPSDSPAFTGRHREVDRILSLAHDRTSATVAVTAIDGMAGVGKTALAVHAAHRLGPAFPDGQLFVDLHGHTDDVEPMGPAAALEALLRALGITSERIPPGLDERAALYRTRLADRHMLIVLDDAAGESQVTPLIPAAPGCSVLITSRRRLIGITDARHVSLDVLPPSDAITLFTHPLDATRLAAEASERLAEVVELCGRLPLALRIAAARLNSRPAWTLADLAERLAGHHYRLTEPRDGRRSVNAALDLSYRHLTPEQRRVYRLLSLHPGIDVDAFAATALADTGSVAQTVRLLDDLVDSHLLTEPAPGRYRFHDLVRAHARTTATAEDTEPERHATLDRLLGHYAHTSSVAMNAVYPYETDERPGTPTATTPTPYFADPGQAETWLDTELDNLLAATAHRRPHHTLHQSATLHRHLRARGRYEDTVTLHQRAVHVASTTSNPTGERDALNRLGEIHYMIGRYEQALRCFRRGLDLARTSGDRAGELSALFGFGYVHRARGHYAESGDSYGRGLDLARATGNRAGELFALAGVGHVHRALGRYEEAEHCLRQALDLACTAGDRSGELYVRAGLGDVCRAQGLHKEAMAHYEQAWHIARTIGDRSGEIEASDGLGRSHQALGRHQEALACHRTALSLATELGHPADRARAHDGLAHAHHALGRPDHASRHWQDALDILTAHGHDRTWDPQVTTATLRARLRDLDAQVPR